MKSLFLALIKFYQKNISPLTPPTCRYIPTCSNYAYEAISKYGAAKGLFMALGRFIRCHPFHSKDHKIYDPVP